MTKLKSEYPKVTFRPTTESLKVFNRAYKSMKKREPYTTKDRILNELLSQFNSGKITMPWEE